MGKRKIAYVCVLLTYCPVFFIIQQSLAKCKVFKMLLWNQYIISKLINIFSYLEIFNAWFLTFTVKISPNIVNIHVKHPPEVTLQFHQVSRIDSTSAGQKPKPKLPTSGHSQSPYQSLPFQKTQKIHSPYIHQQPITHTFPVSAKTQLGRCFQETVGTQVIF